MAGSSSSAIFDSLELNPQLFINEILNSVDDVLDGAFDFYRQEALGIVGGEDRVQEVDRGVTFLRNLTQEALDKRLDMWEKYCLRHCFTVPDGFVMPNAQDASSNDLLPLEELSDPVLDSQLDSLRKKLVAAGQESVELQNEIRTLEKQSSVSSKFDTSVAEALQVSENSAQEMYKEIGKSAAQLQLKLKAAAFNITEQEAGLARIWKQEDVGPNQGLSARLEDIQESLSRIRSI